MSRKCTRFVCFLLFFYKWTDKEVELSLRITLQDCKVAKAGENVVLVFQRRIAIASGQPFEKMQSEGRTKVTLIFNNALNPDSRQHNNCSTTSHASLFVLTWPRHVTKNMSQFLSISVFSAHTTTRKWCVFFFFFQIYPHGRAFMQEASFWLDKNIVSEWTEGQNVEKKRRFLIYFDSCGRRLRHSLASLSHTHTCNWIRGVHAGRFCCPACDGASLALAPPHFH